MRALIYSLSVPVLVGSAYGAQYLTVAQAQRALFPAATSFVERKLDLSAEQVRRIEARARARWRLQRQRVWEATAADQPLGYVIVDQVYGKHEFITYAVAIDLAGKISAVEILEYRESYGGEVRNPQWRAQFVGKRSGDAVELDKDIRNISGATLSCQHVTEGIRRNLAFFDVVIKNK